MTVTSTRRPLSAWITMGRSVGGVDQRGVGQRHAGHGFLGHAGRDEGHGRLAGGESGHRGCRGYDNSTTTHV
ncbi:MAG: hypothetical protein ACKOFP_14360, partial [Actinomycetota bacterium]